MIAGREKRRAWERRYYKKNRKKMIQNCLDYQKRNPDKMQAYSRMYRAKNPDIYMIAQAKNRAKTCGLEFSLTRENFPEFPKVCPILGIPIERGKGRLEPGSPTLDRIDPTKGYTPDNVQIISWRANDIKKNATLEELTKLVTYLTKLKRSKTYKT